MGRKKILIGSILIVTALILMTFASVVGYNSQTFEIKESPLFAVRSSRAIDEESMDIVCDYAGKAEYVDLYFPERNVTKIRIGNLFKKLNVMNKKEIERLVNFLNKQIYNKNNLFEEIRKINELKTTPDETLDNYGWTCERFTPVCLLLWVIEWILFIGITASIALGLVTIPLFLITAEILGAIGGFSILILIMIMTVSPIDCSTIFCPM